MDAEIARELDQAADQFDGLKGELVAAAVRMFLQASPQAQAGVLKEVMGAKVDRFTKTRSESESAIKTVGRSNPPREHRGDGPARRGKQPAR